MFCQNCGAQIPNEARYCPYCAYEKNVAFEQPKSQRYQQPLAYNHAVSYDFTNSPYRTLLATKIKKAKTCSLVGMIMSIAIPIVFIIFCRAAFSQSHSSQHQDEMMIAGISFFVLLALGVFSAIVLFNSYKKLKTSQEMLLLNPNSVEQVQSVLATIKYPLLTAVMIVSIIPSVIFLPLCFLFLAQILACIFTKDLKKQLYTTPTQPNINSNFPK